MIHDKNSGKIYFARCFLECIKAILTESGQKKWSQLSESTRRAKPDEEPERSDDVARSDGNRNQVRIALLATANKQSGDTGQKQRQNSFCKMFLECIEAILTNFGKKNGANYRNRTDDLFITSELLYRLS